MSKEKKPSEFKNRLNQVVEVVKTIPNIWTNIKQLIQAVSLLVCGGFSYWGSYSVDFQVNEFSLALRFCAVIIALTGAYEFIKQMNKRGE